VLAPGEENLIKKLTILMLLLSLPDFSFAEDNKKISIAIMEFRANNTKEGFGKACMDMLSERLFASKLFTLMEKSQMDRIARLNGFQEFSTVDPGQIAKLGRVLKVDKMLVGSITYIDSYIIDIKIVDSITGEIEFNVQKKISSIEKLENAIGDMSQSIERHCMGYYNISGKYDIVFEMQYLNPVGIFRNAVNPGIGLQGVLQFNNPFDVPFDIQAAAGFYNFTPGNKSVNYFYMAPLYLSVSYKFSFTRNINFYPSAGAGYFFSRISCDNSKRTSGLYWDDKSLYYNPSIVIRTELDILLYDRWYLVAAPQYNVFFEEDNVGQFASLGLGLKMLF